LGGGGGGGVVTLYNEKYKSIVEGDIILSSYSPQY